VSYSVQANLGNGTRGTTLTIAGLSFTINQLNGCVFGLTPSSASFSANGGNGSIGVGASGSSCAFTALTSSPFIMVNSTDTSSVSYSVFPNSSSIGRTGAITVAGQTFTVIQAGTACSYALAEASQAVTSSGGAGMVLVQAPAGCSWTAQSNSPFVTITGNASGSGNGTVSYAVPLNPARTQRTGNLTVASLPYAVNQSGVSPLTCAANAPSATQVAIEGRTETLGDLILTCTGLTSPLIADISLTLNTDVTNKITGGFTDATLLVNGVFNPTGGVVSGYNTLDWPGVPLSPASGGTATVRITNVRADASLLGAPANLQSTPVTGVVNVSAAVPVPVSNASQILAYAAPTVVFQKGSASAQVAVGLPQTTIPLQYQEATLTAFHAEGATPGTRLRMILTNLPDNVQVLVPVFPKEGASKAQLYFADSNGVGGSPAPGLPGAYLPVAVSGGVATATWVVLSADPLQFETDTFPVLVQNAFPEFLTGVQVAGSLAPVSTVSVASTTAPLPRFRDFSVPQSLVNLRASVTAQGPGIGSSVAFSNAAKTTSRLISATVGSNGTFSNQLTNDNQDSPATNVMVGSKVMGGTITGCQTTAGTCSMSGNDATINVGTLAPMQSVTVTVSVVAAACTSEVCEVQNDVSTISDQPNADLAASSASSEFLINGPPPGTPVTLAASLLSTPQSTAVGTAFANPLEVTVTDVRGNPVVNQVVTFSAPALGAGAVLSSSTAVTNPAGVASVTATANGAQGSFTATATVAGLSVSFSLTNTAQVAAPSSGDLAQGQSATQSSTLPGTPPASVVVDGNTDGIFSDGSVTATNVDANPWWQVDLGSSVSVSSIVVWNRTDCCGSRLSDYWVFVSNTPFLSTDNPATLQLRAGTFSSHQTSAPNPSATIAAGTQGRYVRIQLSSPNYLSLAEVQVFSGPQGPIGPVATQSSTLPGTPPASVAIDGNTNGNFAVGSVTATNFESNPWWQEDLGVSTAIGSVVVWNRTDCCGDRLSDYWLFVSDTPFLATDTPATLQFRPGTLSRHLTSAPNPSTSIAVGAQGRYIRVQLSSPNYLSLAEVQVQSGVQPPNSDLAQGKAATQSSTLPGTPAAGAAVDGITDGNFLLGSVTASNFESNPWWQVDLGASTPIGSIAIWNRTDCCGARLNDYWVFVSDTPFLNTDTPATLQFRPGTFSSHQTAVPNPSVILTAATQGRYVRIQLSTPNYLSLAEVQVFGPGGGNPGPSIVATESSTLSGSPPASAAIDGNTNGNFNSGSVTATNLDNNAWWQVDLGNSTTVNSVTVWNRTDCCGSRLSDYWVFVSNTPFLNTDTPDTLAFRTDIFRSHQTSAPNPAVTIPAGVQGRYVRVQLSGADYLSLAEVQVR
jgi:hypothetical protein